MSVLAHFRYQNAWISTILLRKPTDQLSNLLELILSHPFLISSPHHLVFRHKPAMNLFNRI